MRDGPVAVPGVMTTSTSSKIAGHVAVTSASALRIAASRRSDTSPPILAKARLRRSRRSAAAARHVVVDAAEVARQCLAVHRARSDSPDRARRRRARVRAAARPPRRPQPAAPSDPRRQRRRHLGAQRNSQPPGVRRPRRRSRRRVRRRRHVEEQRGVLDGPRERAVDAQAAPRAVVRRQRHPIALRLDAEQPAPRRRDADRAHAVGAERQRGKACRHGRSAATAAASRCEVRVPRVARRPEGQGLGERPDHQLRNRRLAEDDGARLAQPAHHLGVLRRAGRGRWCRRS